MSTYPPCPHHAGLGPGRCLCRFQQIRKLPSTPGLTLSCNHHLLHACRRQDSTCPPPPPQPVPSLPLGPSSSLGCVWRDSRTTRHQFCRALWCAEVRCSLETAASLLEQSVLGLNVVSEIQDMPSPLSYTPGTVFGELKGSVDRRGQDPGTPRSWLCSPGLCGEPLGSQVSRPGQRGARLVLLSRPLLASL